MPKAVAIVLSSGGLHSLVTAALASREYRVGLVHILDGRATAKQAQAAFERQVTHFKPMKSWTIDGEYLRQMSLPPEMMSVVNSTGSDPQSNLIPMRSMQMLSIAAGLAQQMRASAILWGIQFEQKQSELLAKNIEMVQVYNQLLELMGGDSPAVLKTPLMGLEDHQVVELGYQMGVPFVASWTCQLGMENPCMSCPACSHRMRAFRMAQLMDPLVLKARSLVEA
jgi:7-cyano-7-deazaguanine synthase